MAIKIYEKFAPFANPATGDYPHGSIKNDSIPGAEDGTPLDADLGNDYVGFDAALLAEAGITPSGLPDTAINSQRLDAVKSIVDLRSISRSLNVLDSQVICSTNTTTQLGPILYIHDAATQKTWAKPANVGATEVIVSVSAGGVLTTNVTTYQMLPASDIFKLTADAINQPAILGTTFMLADRMYATFKVTGVGTANGIDTVQVANGYLATIQPNTAIMSARAYGAKLDWNGTTGTDDTNVLQRLHQLNVKYSLDGKFAKISGSLEIVSGLRVYSFGGGIHKENVGYIFTTLGAGKEDAIVEGGFYSGNLLASFADCSGSGVGFNNAARSIVFNDCRTAGIDTAFMLSNARVCRINRGRYACKTAVTYTNKSAECVIDSSLFVKDEGFPTIGTVGLNSLAGVNGYPEGLSVHKTLFYRFERNLDVSDLFIADFTGCYFDSGGADVKQSRIKYTTKTEGMKFTSCWWFSRGIEWGDDTAIAPQKFRSQMDTCHFNYMSPGIDVMFRNFAHGVTVSNPVHDSDNTGTHIGYVANNQNNRIILSNLNFENYDSYVQFKGAGVHNSITNVPNGDNLTSPVFLEYPVNIYNVEGYALQVEDTIVNGTYTGGAEIASIDNINLSSGTAWVTIDISNIVATASGFIQLLCYTAGTTTPNPDVTLLTNVSYTAYTATDKQVKVTVPVKVLRATRCKMQVRNEANSASITAGASFDSITVSQ